jgi:endonuclease G
MTGQDSLEAIKQRFGQSLRPGTDIGSFVQRATEHFLARGPVKIGDTVEVAEAVPAYNTEAIVQRYIRPPMLISDSRVDYKPVTEFPELTHDAVRGIEPMIPSIGRVEFLNHSMRWGGTGFIVERLAKGRSVFATNRHVAELVARRVRDGSAVFLRSNVGVFYGMKLDMREEANSIMGGSYELRVERIRYLADTAEADVSLIEVQTSEELDPNPLPFAAKPAVDRELVATIGYPAYDSRNDLTQLREYFGDLYDVKRFSGGLVMKEGGSLVLRYDCTTTGGCSGSPLVSLEQKAVVGLHFMGEFGIANAAVGVETLKRLLSGAGGAVVTGADLGTLKERADGTHEAAYFKGRRGFDQAFLGKGFEVAWPRFSDDIAHDLQRPSDQEKAGGFELKYTNFGVLYSKSRRCPRITAVNVDGEKAVRIKRGDDQWFFDLRIPRDLQLGQKAYSDPQIDRGHMVRREDPNWGAQAATANDDTFHYTNSALQHSSLNQGKTLWQGIENYILDSARTKGFKACVFTGPVLRADDPPLPESDELVPIEFWKIVAMRSVEGGLHATAYLLSQGDLIRDLLQKRRRTESAEGFVLGPYRTFQVAITHIEEITGFKFDNLRDADPLSIKAVASEFSIEDAVIYRPLDILEDAVLAKVGNAA